LNEKFNTMHTTPTSGFRGRKEAKID